MPTKNGSTRLNELALLTAPMTNPPTSSNTLLPVKTSCTALRHLIPSDFILTSTSATTIPGTSRIATSDVKYGSVMKSASAAKIIAAVKVTTETDP